MRGELNRERERRGEERVLIVGEVGGTKRQKKRKRERERGM